MAISAIVAKTQKSKCVLVISGYYYFFVFFTDSKKYPQMHYDCRPVKSFFVMEKTQFEYFLWENETKKWNLFLTSIIFEAQIKYSAQHLNQHADWH